MTATRGLLCAGVAGFCAGFLRPRRWRDGGALDAGAAVARDDDAMPRCRPLPGRRDAGALGVAMP
ncbi:hypothetical protein ACVWZW_003539 [Bradyrhizobium sp. F1.13.4]